MVPDDRSSGGNNVASFDFNSQAGVLAVLGAIRASEISTTDRNELRDLVFLYSNGGGDVAVRTVLEERLREANITPALIPRKGRAAQAGTIASAGFASGRPMPQFVPATVATSIPALSVAPVTPAPLPVTPVAAAPVVPLAPLPVTLATPVVASVPTPQPRPVVLVPRPSAAPVSPVTPVAETPVAPRVIRPVTPAVPAETALTAPPTASVLTPPPVVEITPAATTARLERIRTIKSDVNNQVGNPVNLVAMDKAIGSEYMSALLEAMKLLSSASDVESARAMSRLEAVYGRVQELFKTIATPVTVPVAPVSQPLTTPVQAITPPQTGVGLVPPPLSPVTAWGQTDTVADMAVVPLRSVADLPPVADPLPVPPLPVPPRAEPQRSVAASQVPLRSISELPTADEVNSSSNTGDSLFTKEVDAGLEQLLSEWTLFKKSGLFGTGPSGRNHALFLKLAPLALPLILAGRFEGSTQEIKQSITDYMNGWRYEQGIIYEKEETFERYLRRVIRHIIDLQNKKRGT